MEGALSPRSNHVAVAMGKKLLIYGDSLDNESGAFYDPRLDRWQPVPSPVVKRTSRNSQLVTAAWTGQAFVIRGNNLKIYDPFHDSWIWSANIPPTESEVTFWTGKDFIAWDFFQSQGNKFIP